MAGPQHRTPEYRAARKRYTAAQRAGQWHQCVQPVCVMPTRDIAPTEPLDVAHDDTGTVILGPAHSKCNRTDGGVRRHGGTVAGSRRSTRRSGRSGGTLAKRECVVCGSTYTPTHSKQASCSRTCGAQMKKLGIQPAAIPAQTHRRCGTCGVHFPSDGTPRFYCESCGAPSDQPKVQTRTCERCTQTFQQHGSGRPRRWCPDCSPPLDSRRLRREVL